ncbi:MAG: XdhC/CoxI family protein [Thermodesulfobacteriota bacterium]
MTPELFFKTLCERKPAGVMATVLSSDGQGPARPGDRLFWSEGRLLAGTVGGGSNEQQVLAACEKLEGTKLELEIDSSLPGPLPSCGGRLRIRLERVDFGNPEEIEFWRNEAEQLLSHQHRLYLMGAGHVAREVAWLAERNGFHVILVDPRRELVSEEYFPGTCELHCRDQLSFLSETSLRPHDYLIIAGPDHATDLAILEQGVHTPAAYIGVMGSRKKIDSFEKILEKKGLWQLLDGRLHAPIGIPIPSKTPAEVAVSIVAELIGIRAQSARKQ